MSEFASPDLNCPVLPVYNEDNFVSERVRHMRAQICLAAPAEVPMDKLCNMHNALRHLLGTPRFLSDTQLTVYLDDENGHCAGAVAQWYDQDDDCVHRIEFSFIEGKTWVVSCHPFDPSIFNRQEYVDIPDETGMDDAASAILKALEAESIGAVRFPELD